MDQEGCQVHHHAEYGAGQPASYPGNGQSYHLGKVIQQYRAVQEEELMKVDLGPQRLEERDYFCLWWQDSLKVLDSRHGPYLATCDLLHQ
jgi:hypothetical protein